jgi:hypothetical protein
MSKCVVCGEFLHPDFCIEKEIRGDKVISCLFCHLDKSKLTIEDKDGKILRKVTKSQCIKEYKMYLKRLMDNPNIAKLVKQENES